MEFDNHLLMELILMFQNDKHYDELHHFVDDEPLDSLDRDKLLSSLFRPVKKRNVLCAGEHVKWNINSQNV